MVEAPAVKGSAQAKRQFQPGQGVEQEAHVLGGIRVGAGRGEGGEGVDDDQVEPAFDGCPGQEIDVLGQVDGRAGGGIGEDGPPDALEIGLGGLEARQEHAGGVVLAGQEQDVAGRAGLPVGHGAPRGDAGGDVADEEGLAEPLLAGDERRHAPRDDAGPEPYDLAFGRVGECLQVKSGCALCDGGIAHRAGVGIVRRGWG